MLACRIVALAAIGIAVHGQIKPKDVNGWDRVQWGMTVAQVRAAYGIQALPENKDGWTLLQLPPFKLRDIEMGVETGARQGPDKVTLVRLWSSFGLPESKPSAAAPDFDTVREALIERYGQPASEEESHGENFRLLKTATWKFPSTTILLSLEQSSSLPNLGTIFIDFTATDLKR